jgi:hypothetical protein
MLLFLTGHRIRDDSPIPSSLRWTEKESDDDQKIFHNSLNDCFLHKFMLTFRSTGGAYTQMNGLMQTCGYERVTIVFPHPMKDTRRRTSDCGFDLSYSRFKHVLIFYHIRSVY